MNNNRVSLISLNIEKDKHLNRVRNFFNDQGPDVICLQEVFERDFETLKRELNMEGVFAPMAHTGDAGFILGVAIFSRFKIISKEVLYYAGDEKNIPVHDESNNPKSYNRAVLMASIGLENGEIFNIGTTHFTWTYNGEADEFQREDVSRMLSLLDNKKSFILCGDFNAPRGKEIFSIIASKYKDNIPPEYESSIDPDLHRKKDLRLMVDGLFSTPDYKAEDVKLVSGVSDHCAMTANISK